LESLQCRKSSKVRISKDAFGNLLQRRRLFDVAFSVRLDRKTAEEVPFISEYHHKKDAVLLREVIIEGIERMKRDPTYKRWREKHQTLQSIQPTFEIQREETARHE
jgi:hypothetical protein